MTPFPYAVDSAAPIGEARALMMEHQVRHLPVIANDTLVGIVTDRDIKLILGPELGSPDPKAVTVEEAMVENPFTVAMDAPLVDVLEAMSNRHIGAVLVTRHGKLAGIFTSSDACAAFAERLRKDFPTADGPDRVA